VWISTTIPTRLLTAHLLFFNEWTFIYATSTAMAALFLETIRANRLRLPLLELHGVTFSS